MAKMFSTRYGKKLWALTKAEDFILIDGYLAIKPFVPSFDIRFIDFERQYFDEGLALSDQYLLMLNNHLTRKGFDAVCFREGHTDSYSAVKGARKAEERRDICESLATLDRADLAMVIQKKQAEIRLQHPRDLVYDAVKATRATPLTTYGTVRVARTQLTDGLIEGIEGGHLELKYPARTKSTPRVDRATSRRSFVVENKARRAAATPRSSTSTDQEPSRGDSRRTITVLGSERCVSSPTTALVAAEAPTKPAFPAQTLAESVTLQALLQKIVCAEELIREGTEELAVLTGTLKGFLGTTASVADPV